MEFLGISARPAFAQQATVVVAINGQYFLYTLPLIQLAVPTLAPKQGYTVQYTVDSDIN